MIHRLPTHDGQAFREPSAIEEAEAVEAILRDFDREGYDSALMERIMECSPREMCDVLVKLGRDTNDDVDLSDIESDFHKFLRAEACRMIRGYDAMAWDVWRMRRAGR